jgi:DnaK suppressor protein
VLFFSHNDKEIKDVNTKRISNSKAGKKMKTKVVGKKVIPRKGTKISVKTATTKKVSAKVPTKKKQVQGRTLGDKIRTTKSKGVVATKSESKKKLSPRGKLIQEIRKKLAMQHNELLSEAEKALNMLPGQTIFPDMGDQASAEIDHSFMLCLRGREQRLLKKIEQAIEKIENGSFGICEVCGEEIGLKRLDARPVTTMCILCKTEQEEDEKLRMA